MENLGIYTDYPIKKEKNISGGKLYPSVNCEDDYHMTYVAGIRPPHIHKVSFQKSREDRLALEKAKRQSEGAFGRKGPWRKNTKQELVGKLIIHIKNTEPDPAKRNMFKTTYCLYIPKSEVDSTLADYKRKYTVIKYYFNY